MLKQNKKPKWLCDEALFEAETEIKYEGYIKRHLTQLKNELKNESQPININFNYSYLLISRKSVLDDNYKIIKEKVFQDFEKIK